LRACGWFKENPDLCHGRAASGGTTITFKEDCVIKKGDRSFILACLGSGPRCTPPIGGVTGLTENTELDEGKFRVKSIWREEFESEYGLRKRGCHGG